MISPAGVDDAPGIAALVSVVHPERLGSPAGLRHWLESTPVSACHQWWKAEMDGTVVGWGVALLQAWSTSPGDASAGVIVHPDVRGRGLGSTLWERVLAHLVEVGGTHVVVQSVDDDVARGFCERRGFRLSSSSDILAVDPRTLPAPPDPGDGIAVRPCAAYRDDLDSLYRVDYTASQDEPSDYDFSGLTFEQWRAMTFEHPDFDPQLSVVVEARGEPVGVSLLLVDRERGRAVSVGTSVLREHRGRGLALLMKRHSLAAAGEAGITRAVTANDETNAPMLAINRALGYEPFTTHLGWVLDR
jgi:GNAT superfamily N-acetyltransferase